MKHELKVNYVDKRDKLKYLSSKADRRALWFISFQDICPAEIFGGIEPAIRYVRKHRRFDIPSKSIHSMIETYWDAFLINVFRATVLGKLPSVYRKLETLMGERLKELKVVES